MTLRIVTMTRCVV